MPISRSRIGMGSLKWRPMSTLTDAHHPEDMPTQSCGHGTRPGSLAQDSIDIPEQSLEHQCHFKIAWS